MAVVLALALLAWMMLDFGRWRYVLDLNDEHSAWRINHELEQQNHELNAQIKRVTRAMQIEEDSRKELQEDISRLHGELAELQQEVAFYRSIIPSAEPETGPRVEGFRISKSDQEGHYQYRIVLTHVGGDARLVEGSIIMRIEGKQNGTARTVDLADLGDVAANRLDYKFKHFQRFEGVFRIPDNFVVETVHLRLREKNQRKDSFHKSYGWSDLAG